MTIQYAALLGVLQGLTEFLPISSSGHLVLAQEILNLQNPGVLFEAVLHLGTMLAIIWYFRRKILSLSTRFIALLVVGSIPAGVVGLLFADFIEGLFSNPQVVAIALLFTGLLNWSVDGFGKRAKNVSKMGFLDAAFVGSFQALAIIPGISRSGSTIFAGLWRGITREDAASFSFLLSIPAIAGSVGLQLLRYQSVAQVNMASYFMGAIVAFVVGYFAISILMRLLVQKRFKIFALYCWLLGLTTLLLTL